MDQAELMKIRVFGDDGEAVVFGIVPDGEVIGFIKTNEFNLGGVGVSWLQLFQ